MIPDLNGDQGTSLPRGSKDHGGGFILLCARDTTPHPIQEI